MPHDKIKDAARKRMTGTGESYTVARREVIRLHREEAFSRADAAAVADDDLDDG